MSTNSDVIEAIKDDARRGALKRSLDLRSTAGYLGKTISEKDATRLIRYAVSFVRWVKKYSRCSHPSSLPSCRAHPGFLVLLSCFFSPPISLSHLFYFADETFELPDLLHIMFPCNAQTCQKVLECSPIVSSFFPPKTPLHKHGRFSLWSTSSPIVSKCLTEVAHLRLASRVEPHLKAHPSDQFQAVRRVVATFRNQLEDLSPVSESCLAVLHPAGKCSPPDSICQGQVILLIRATQGLDSFSEILDSLCWWYLVIFAYPLHQKLGLSDFCTGQ